MSRRWPRPAAAEAVGRIRRQHDGAGDRARRGLASAASIVAGSVRSNRRTSMRWPRQAARRSRASAQCALARSPGSRRADLGCSAPGRARRRAARRPRSARCGRGVHRAHRRPVHPGAAALGRTFMPCVTSKSWPLKAADSSLPKNTQVWAMSAGTGSPSAAGSPSKARGAASSGRSTRSRCCRFGALELVHRGEHAADALAADRPGEDRVDADAASPSSSARSATARSGPPWAPRRPCARSSGCARRSSTR
jgi:hypothetical protein